MELHFSDKFDPLFDILDCWNECAREDFKTVYTPSEQDYWLALKGVDTIINSGSRDSGKTFVETTWIPIAVRDYDHRVLLTRYIMGTTDQSVSEALDKRIATLGMDDDFCFANNTYTLTKNKDKHEDDTEEDGKIFITGVKTSSLKQTAKLKSIENFSIYVTEEAEELVSYEDWSKTKKSLRAPDVQCLALLTLNPPTREHWINERFFEDMGVPENFCGIKDNVMYIHTTIHDNVDSEGNTRLVEHNVRAYGKLEESYNLYESMNEIERESSPKIKKEWREYKTDCLGEWRDIAEGVIYENWEIGEFPDTLPYAYGEDFGSSDPDAITKVAIDHNNMKVHIDEIHFKDNTGTAQLMQYIHDKVGYVDLIYADSASRRLIHDFQDGMHSPSGEWLCGVNMKPVQKSKGAKLNFVADSLNKCRSYKLVFTPRSVNCIKAVRNYVWHDKRSGVPDHYLSDLPDSWRYGIVGQLND